MSQTVRTRPSNKKVTETEMKQKKKMKKGDPVSRYQLMQNAWEKQKVATK